MDNRDTYRKEIDARFNEWKVKIDQLEANISTLSLEVKKELLAEIDDLRRQKTVMREKWNELQKAGGDTKEQIKEGLDRAEAKLKDALEKVLLRFR